MKGGQQIGGKMFEKSILTLFKSYETRNIHCQQNFPEKLQSGQTVRKHGFDFQCLYNNKFYAFDAKHCDKELFYLSNCKIHQIKALLDIEKQGGEGFFFIYFAQKKKINKISAKTIAEYLEKGYTSIMFNDTFESNLNFLNIK